MEKINKKQKLQKLRLKNKEQIEIAKQKHALSLEILKNKIETSKKEERKLSLQLEKEFQDFKQKQKLESIHNKKVIKEKRDLIFQNKTIIDKKKKEQKKEIALHQLNIKNQLKNAKNENRKKVLEFKQKLRKQKQEEKIKLQKLKSEFQKKKIELQKTIDEQKQVFLDKQLETQTFISEKQKELFKRKQDLNEEILEQKTQKKKDHNEQIIEVRKKQEDLKLEKIQAKSDIKTKILEIKLKNAKSERERTNILDKLNETNKDLQIALQNQKENFKNKVANLNSNPNSQQKELVDNKTLEKVIQESKEQDDTNISSKERTKKLFPSEAVFAKKLKVKNTNEEGGILQDNYNNLISGVEPLKFSVRKQKRVLEDFNTINNHYKIKRFSPNIQEKIKLFRKLKKQKEMASIYDFVEYSSFFANKELYKEKITQEFNNILTNILTGKALQFLNGYIFLEKLNTLRYLVFSQNLNRAHTNKVVSFPENKFYEFLNFLMLDKLSKGTVIQINQNAALLKEYDQLIFIHDVGFLKGV